MCTCVKEANLLCPAKISWSSERLGIDGGECRRAPSMARSLVLLSWSELVDIVLLRRRDASHLLDRIWEVSNAPLIMYNLSLMILQLHPLGRKKTTLNGLLSILERLYTQHPLLGPLGRPERPNMNLDTEFLSEIFSRGNMRWRNWYRNFA